LTTEIYFFDFYFILGALCFFDQFFLLFYANFFVFVNMLKVKGFQETSVYIIIYSSQIIHLKQTLLFHAAKIRIVFELTKSYSVISCWGNSPDVGGWSLGLWLSGVAAPQFLVQDKKLKLPILS